MFWKICSTYLTSIKLLFNKKMTFEILQAPILIFLKSFSLIDFFFIQCAFDAKKYQMKLYLMLCHLYLRDPLGLYPEHALGIWKKWMQITDGILHWKLIWPIVRTTHAIKYQCNVNHFFNQIVFSFLTEGSYRLYIVSGGSVFFFNWLLGLKLFYLRLSKPPLNKI